MSRIEFWNTPLLSYDKIVQRRPYWFPGFGRVRLQLKDKNTKNVGQYKERINMTDELAFTSATELLAKYKAKTLSPVEAV